MAVVVDSAITLIYFIATSEQGLLSNSKRPAYLLPAVTTAVGLYTIIPVAGVQSQLRTVVTG